MTRYGCAVALGPLLWLVSCHTPAARRLPNERYERYAIHCDEDEEYMCRADADEVCPKGYFVRSSDVQPDGSVGVAHAWGSTTFGRTRATYRLTMVVDCKPE